MNTTAALLAFLAAGCGTTSLTGTPRGLAFDAAVLADSDSAASRNDGTPLESGLPDASTVNADAAMFGPWVRLPCNASLPTGFCLVSDPGDIVGAGTFYEASGASTVVVTTSAQVLTASLTSDEGSIRWTAQFETKPGETPHPGLFEPAERYPFNMGTPGLLVRRQGSECKTLTGRFSIDELASAPEIDITHFSVTFEQHCDGNPAALRGVIHYQATGRSDEAVRRVGSIVLTGDVSRLVYDSKSHLAYGLDATNRKLAKINLAAESVTYTAVAQTPNDACVNPKRSRLYTVDKASSIITEYDLEDLRALRDIPWKSTDTPTTITHFQVYCASDRLYLVDGAWAPGLYTIDDLDATQPIVVDHSDDVSGVGALALSASEKDVYYWYQYGWQAGTLNTAVHRLRSADLAIVDETTPENAPDFRRDPIDTPLLLDEKRGLVLAKNQVFDLSNLSQRVFTLPGKINQLAGPEENIYALDINAGLIATHAYIYELQSHEIISPTLTRSADQMFFDRDGLLWFLTASASALEAQQVASMR